MSVHPPLPFRGDYIDGRFVEPTGARTRRADPGDLDAVVGEAPLESVRSAEAVAAARAALASWRSRSAADREQFLRRYQTLLATRGEALAQTIARETGKPWKEARDEVTAMGQKVDVTVREGLPLVADRVFPIDGEARGAIRYRPRGVVGVIGPFNVPGHLPNGQIVPALLLGNTVVFKPSELAPFTGQFIAELLHDAGLPPGVFNLVQGGKDTGSALAGQAGLDALFFTGSAATGRRVQERWDQTPGRVLALEMGGKNAALVFPDAPWSETLDQIISGAFSTSGQRCSSTSRVIVQKEVAARFLKDFMSRVAGLTVGYYPDQPFLGPLIDGRAVDRFLAAQMEADRLGFQTLQRGEPLVLNRRGHYVRPSVHLWEGPPAFLSGPGETPGKYWDEELFAPDVAVYVVDGEESMVALNNASRFGLAAAVFTADEDRFHRLAPQLENGVVHWNRSTAMTPGRLPFGGLKASGNGWPAGLFVSYVCAAPWASMEMPARRDRSDA